LTLNNDRPERIKKKKKTEVLTVAFQNDIVRVSGVVKRERDVVRLCQVQHGLQQ